jgi:hypothetical protein
MSMSSGRLRGRILATFLRNPFIKVRAAAEEIILEANHFFEIVERWIAANHPVALIRRAPGAICVVSPLRSSAISRLYCVRSSPIGALD